MTETESWSVLPYTEATAAQQLQETERMWQAVAASERGATLRWYGYKRRAVVLGVGQQLTSVDAGALREVGIEVEKRSSGGTAVLVEPRSPALDVALPADHPLAGSDVLEAYRWLGEVFLAALSRLAKTAARHVSLASIADARADQRAQREADPESAASLRARSCFGTLSPYEVVLAGGNTPRKLVGLSQLRKRGVVLYQAGMYVRVPNAALVDVLGIDPALREPLRRELERRTAGLEALGLSSADRPALMNTVNEAAARRLERATAAVQLMGAVPARSAE